MNRLGPAKWIVSPGNPLTARVAVNHFWQEDFGVGNASRPRRISDSRGETTQQSSSA